MSVPMRLARRAGVALLSTVLIGGAFAAPALAATPVSQATAQAVNLGLLGTLDLAASPTPTTSTNDGGQSNAATDNTPAVSLLTTQSFLGAGALQETTEANTDGSSYGCAGVVSPNSAIQVGDAGTTCSVTGNGTGGVTLDLKAIPQLGAALAPFGQLEITLDSVTAHGYQDATSGAQLGAGIAGATITGCLTGVIATCLGTPVTVPITLAGTPNENLLTAALTSLAGSSGLTVAVDTLSNALTPVLSLVTNYQPGVDANGISSVSGIHLGLLGTTAAADIAKVTVGANAQAAPVPSIAEQGVPIALAVLAALALAVFLIRRSRLNRPIA